MLLAIYQGLISQPWLLRLLLGLTLLTVAVCSVGIYARRMSLLKYRRPKNLKQVGSRFPHLYNQTDPGCDASNSSSNSKIRIKALYIHPIKSCKPIEVDNARLTKIGFAYDRSFVFAVTKDKGECEFISQRTKPKMCLVEQELWLPHPDSDSSDALVKAGGCLIVSFPDPRPITTVARFRSLLETGHLGTAPRIVFRVPLAPEYVSEYDLSFPLRNFKIHSRNAHGLDYGQIPEIASALPLLKQFLHIPTRQELILARCTNDTLVRTTRNLAPLRHIGTPAMIGYTDQQPIHIVTLPSVQAFSQLLPSENQPLDARRFRANIYLAGSLPYEEETWKRFQILSEDSVVHGRPPNPIALSVVCRTSRCTMPNVIPEKGIFDEEHAPVGRKRGKAQPSTALVEHRTVEAGNPAALGYMGMHCVPEDASLKTAGVDSEVWVRVGDEIEVLETGDHLYGSTGNDY